MRKTTALSVILFSLFATGCASKYQLSQEGLAFQSTLTEKSALKTVELASKSTNESRGLCLSFQSNFDPYTVIDGYKFDKRVVAFEGKYTRKFKTTLDTLESSMAEQFPDTDPKINQQNIQRLQIQAMMEEKKYGRRIERDAWFDATVTVPKQYQLDFSKVKTIRVFSDISSDDRRSCIGEASGKYFVWLIASDLPEKALTPMMIRFNVGEDNIDQFIAAVSYLSPAATVIEGAGI